MHRTHVEAGHRRRLLLVFTLAGGAGVTWFAPAAQAQLAAGDPSARFEMSNWATGLTGPTDLEFLPDGRAVILLKGGEVIVRRRDGTLARRSGQVAVKILNDEQGLLGVAVDPDFTRTKAIYLFASAGDTAVDKHQILRATVSDDDRVQIDAKPIVDKGLEGPANHDGGGLVVHKGQLYFSVGDTGWNATPPTNKYPSCLNKPNGKILRVELDGKVPTDNPLVGLAEVTGCADPGAPFRMMPPDTRVFAWGMRNPYRFWIDPKTDLLWIGDVGEATREEISVGGKGAHFGYPFWEGAQRWTAFGDMTCTSMTPRVDCTPPAFDYENKGNFGDNCVIGGLIPDGCGWPAAYASRYFFGDHATGTIWTLDVTADRRGVVPGSRRDFGRLPGLAGFRMGRDGTLYLVSFDNNSIVQVSPKGRSASCDAQAAGMGGAPASMGATDAASGSGATGATDAASAPRKAGGTDAGRGATGSDGCACAVGARDRRPSRTASGLPALILAAALFGRRRARGGSLPAAKASLDP